jgi:hypothetical protein
MSEDTVTVEQLRKILSDGGAYSRLDVEKAIRIKAAEKATKESVATGDEALPLTLGEARRETHGRSREGAQGSRRS